MLWWVDDMGLASILSTIALLVSILIGSKYAIIMGDALCKTDLWDMMSIDGPFGVAIL